MSSRRNTVYFLIIVMLLSGLFTGRAFFFNLAYLLGALLIIAYFWSFFSVRGIAISRKTRSRRAQVGRNLEEVFVVQNRAVIPKLWLEIRDESDLPGHKASHVVPALGVRSQYRWYVDTPCLVRGEFHLGPLTVVSGDPFGLFSSPRKLAASQRVIVYPQTIPVDDFVLPMGRLTGGEAERRRTPNVTTNVSGIRDYVHGDSFNRIHWKSTSRHGHLMVKEFEIDPLADIWMMVDFSSFSLVEASSVRRMHHGAGPVIPMGKAIPPSTEEYAVVIAASLAQYFIDSERALGFSAYIPHREVFQPERGNRQLLQILRSLAIARSLTPYTLAQMLSLETPHFSRGTTLVIITASIDPAWINEAQLLARKGIRPTCVLIDPSSFGAHADIDEVRTMLRVARIPTIIIRLGDDLSAALAQHPL
ncbi:DUF58 domain-containing protein [Kamptonema cortianum]|nr:DUF58 domain-containing protein [Kamptonema cortianum]